jgi:predicted permease
MAGRIAIAWAYWLRPRSPCILEGGSSTPGPSAVIDALGAALLQAKEGIEMQRIAFSFFVIVASLAAGYAFNRALERGALRGLSASAETLRRGMQKTALLMINPVAFCGAVWVLDLSERRYLALPFLGIAALAAGLALGFAGSRILRLPPAKAGVYVTCASFTNIGNIGGLVVFVLLGEAAFALIPFYKLFEELWYYSLLFPLARSYGARANPGAAAEGAGSGRPAGKPRVARDPFLIVALSSVALGLGLNLAGLERPSFYGPLNAFLVPFSSFLLLFAIGMKMRFAIAREHRLPAAVLVIGKALIVPALVSTLARLCLGSGGLAPRVALVLASMPVGFLALVPPSLYRLDQDFAASLWLASNATIALVVPALALILGS